MAMFNSYVKLPEGTMFNSQRIPSEYGSVVVKSSGRRRWMAYHLVHLMSTMCSVSNNVISINESILLHNVIAL